MISANIAKEILFKLIDVEAIDLKVVNHGIHQPADTDLNVETITQTYDVLYKSIKETIK